MRKWLWILFFPLAVQAAGAQGDKRGVAFSPCASASTHCFCSLEAAAPSSL